MKFEDDWMPEECEVCGGYGCPGSHYYLFRGMYACSDTCLEKLVYEVLRPEVEETEEGYKFRDKFYDDEDDLIEEFGELTSGEIETEYLETSYDKECEWGDMMYHQWKDEGRY